MHQPVTDCDADLLVVGSASRGPVVRMVIDDARGTVSEAPCPVAVASHGYVGRDDEIRTVGVGYDGGVEANTALPVARDVAAARGARVLALTVATPVPGAARHVRTLEEAARGQLRKLEGVEGRVAVGTPGRELVAFGDELDLLVVGSRGHWPLRRVVLGSTSLGLTREARCPLLIIPRTAAARYAHGAD